MNIYEFNIDDKIYVFQANELETKVENNKYSHVTTIEPKLIFLSNFPIKTGVQYKTKAVKNNIYQLLKPTSLSEINHDSLRNMAGYLDKKSFINLSSASRSVRSALEREILPDSKVRLSRYIPNDVFRYETLIVDCDRDVHLTEIFPNITYEVHNAGLNIIGTKNINIDYGMNDISWIPSDIERLSIYSRIFNSRIDRLTNLNYIFINSPIFNQQLNRLTKLTELFITSAVFDKPIDMLVNLVNLTMNSPVFNQPIIHLVNLINLTMVSDQFNYPFTDSHRLMYLYINCPVFNQPTNTLVTLIDVYINSDVFDQEVDDLINLRKLNINCPVFNHPINTLVALLDVYINSAVFNQEVDNLTNLRKLTIYSPVFDQDVDVLHNTEIKINGDDEDDD